MIEFKKRIIALALLGLLVLAAGAQAATYAIDAAHSSVSFKVRHMMVSKVAGTFNTFSGTLEFEEGKPQGWSVEAVIDMASVNTNDAKRDEHLSSPDFFDVEKHPEMTFRSTGVEIDGDDYVLTGELTLMGVTRPVELALALNGEITDPWGDHRAGFSAEGKLDRRDFGMSWNKDMDKGGIVVGNDVSISLEIEAVRQ
ncbi:YceI family protein [bacterium]|nr:YceI family protein [bacterium]MBU1073124.1 YceI family protein [bacterium]MBU1675891.1 YceI family protein [bacterium]